MQACKTCMERVRPENKNEKNEKRKMIEVSKASVKMDGRLLFSGLSFAVEEGRMVCMSGGSGCGKTTLLRAVLGFMPLLEGHISIFGELLTPSSSVEFRRHMSYLPQELAFPVDSVREMVELPFLLKVNKNVRFSKDRLMEEWARLDLDAGLYDKKMSEISGGQRQRIALSVCGLLRKPIFIADEPTSALDVNSSALAAEYIRRMASRGCAALLVSHDTAFAEMCDKRVIIGETHNNNGL